MEMKFNHTKENTFEAIGITQDEFISVKESLIKKIQSDSMCCVSHITEYITKKLNEDDLLFKKAISLLAVHEIDNAILSILKKRGAMDEQIKIDLKDPKMMKKMISDAHRVIKEGTASSGVIEGAKSFLKKYGEK